METTFSSLIKARYQNGQHENLNGPLTPTIEALLRHQSVRGFLDEPLTRGTLEPLITVGQSASTASMPKTWTMVAVQEKELKDAVAKNSSSSSTPIYNTDLFVMASLDAAVAVQKVAVAAESLGLGLCYVGAAHNNAHDLTELLSLPKRCIALFGMAIGKPDPVTDLPATKPRLPMEEVFSPRALER